MDKKVGVFAAVMIIVILLFTGQLVLAGVMLVAAAIVGYAWRMVGDHIYDDVASSVKLHLSANILYLETMCSKKGKDGAYSASELRTLMGMFKGRQIPDKRDILKNLQEMRDDLKGVEKLTDEQHHANRLGGICIGIAFLVMPTKTLVGIGLYLCARWLLMPRYCQEATSP
jgi:hypothetical protein